MPGSNQYIKQLARDGHVCYICEVNMPYRINEFGGAICQECDTRMQAMRLKYALQNGYKLKRPHRADAEIERQEHRSS